MTISVLPLSFGPAQAAAPQEVRVGLSGAFSGSIAYYGQAAQAGIALAIEQINRTRPVAHYTLYTADDQCNPAGGASAYRQLTQVNQVNVILGSTCSGSTLGGMPILQQSQVPGVVFSSVDPKITESGNPYSWRTNLDERTLATTFVEVIKRKSKHVALLFPNNDFGRVSAAIYNVELPKAGVEIADIQYYDITTSDLRAQLTKLKGLQIDGLVLNPTEQSCALAVRQATELGMKVQIYARGGCAEATTIKLLGPDAHLLNGVLEATYWALTPNQEPLASAFKQRYPNDDLSFNSALGYYGMMTVARAVEAGGPSAGGIQAGLGGVRYDSPMGPITFDSHHQAHPYMFLATVQNLKVVASIVRTH